MDLGQLDAIWERLAIAGNAGLIRLDHLRISEDGSHHASTLADGDKLPGLVPFELRKCEPVRHLHCVLVLGGESPCPQNGKKRSSDDRYAGTSMFHLISS